ncbi:MAG: sugar ABC transporter permease [Clostridia bacterium]|nr:sugar ABC transporter permease [Clostridia bacterium]
MELHKKHTIFNNGHRRRQCVFYVCLIAIPLVQFVLMYVCVNFRSILFAFQKYDYETADYAFNFTYFAQNFKTITSELFKGELLGRAWWNSIKSYLVTLLIILPLQVFVAFFVYKKFPLAGYFRIVLYLPSMVAGMTTIIGFKYFVEKGLPMLFPNIKKLTEFGGLLANDSTIFNTLLFYVAWTSLGGGLILMTGTMARTDKEVLEAAHLDGVNLWQEFRHVIWPTLYPVITIQLYTGIVAIFTGGPPLYQFYASNLPNEASTLQYYFFTLVIGSTSSPANYPKAALGGILFTLVAAPIVFFLKWVFEKKDPNN